MPVALLEPLPLLKITLGPSGGDPNGWCTSKCGTSGCDSPCSGNKNHNGSHACFTHS